jgi:Zn-dependent peptidase ImmA (M78 family)
VSTAEFERVAAAVASVRTTLPASGPVRLAEVFDEFDVIRVELPALSRARVFDWLLMNGHVPPDLGGDEDLAGFLFLATSVGVVFVNADDPVYRKRFSAAHELGHLLLHQDALHSGRWIEDKPGTIREVDDDQSRQHEREANRFAADLLMPAYLCRARAQAVREGFPTVPSSVLVHRLAADLLVSREAMGYRLKELEVTHERID